MTNSIGMNSTIGIACCVQASVPRYIRDFDVDFETTGILLTNTASLIVLNNLNKVYS
jgi:hypothetical protein